ncbi:MAG TPA: hypothetical protein VNW53_03215 [Phenylobacterium sp.]|jgi:hypothetical protein|uniref:hypothetical protein n=1 Tax=Phenylobacterium sp. TaxID=1871053 RepID=UPI002C46FD1D|nr:hypothetical protein [Phenylobacterium sp.]HXA37984.1 hypothetical protein [Phenylobacterium sp.]
MAFVSTKSRMDKIGVKDGMRVAVMGVKDPTLSAELAGQGAIPVTELANLDLLFYAADSAEALAHLDALAPMLAEKGALWVVSTKGKAATVQHADVIGAAKAHGLIDNKVVAFSDTQTSLRFTRAKVAAPAEVVAEPGL